MSGPKKVREIRQEGANIDVWEPEDGVSEIYVDGSMGISYSAGVVKVDFYITTGAAEENGVQIEQRLLKHHLVVPTAAWIEICTKWMAGMQSQKDTLLQLIDESRASIADALGEPQKSDGSEKK